MARSSCAEPSTCSASQGNKAMDFSLGASMLVSQGCTPLANHHRRSEAGTKAISLQFLLKHSDNRLRAGSSSTVGFFIQPLRGYKSDHGPGQPFLPNPTVDEAPALRRDRYLLRRTVQSRKSLWQPMQLPSRPPRSLPSAFGSALGLEASVAICLLTSSIVSVYFFHLAALAPEAALSTGK